MRRLTPRVYHAHPPLVGNFDHWPALFDHCRDLGFDHVAISPPFLPGRMAGVLAPADGDRAHPAFGEDIGAAEAVARLATLAGEHGIGLLVDVAVHQMAAEGFAFAADDLPDPRREPASAGARPVDFGSETGQAHLAEWRRRIASLVAAGARGIGVHAAHRLPEEVLADLVAAADGAWVFGYVASAKPARIAAMERAGLAAFVGVYDGRDVSIFGGQENARNIRLIAAPERPFGRRLATEHLDGIIRRRAARQGVRVCGGLGDGLLVPMGFEWGARRSVDPRAGAPGEMQRLREASDGRIAAEIRAVNAFLAAEEEGEGRTLVELTDPGDPIVAMLRADAADLDEARSARLVLANRDLGYGRSLEASSILRMAGGSFGGFESVLGEGEVTTGAKLVLDAGEVWIGRAVQEAPIRSMPQPGPETALAAARAPRLAIEKIEPCVVGGFPVKRTVGDTVAVEADIIADGHEVLEAVVRWRAGDEETWREAPMFLLGNDRWTGSFPITRVGRHQYCIEAWIGPFATFRAGLLKKHDAGVGVSLETEEGRRMVAAWAERAGDGAEIGDLHRRMEAADEGGRLAILLDPETERIMEEADPREQSVLSDPVPVDAERVRAEFASWYEIFPRSQAREPGQHGTFLDVIDQLPRIRDMGFDVLYFPPIHPIGRTNRKGRNNSLRAGPEDPGSPYAIGSEDGGHDALHPDLGTFEDFGRLRDAAHAHGMELAIDFAIQCSPDHPWIREHPEWFDWRPDGTIKFAENPPKKYEDIVNVDFYTEGAVPSLWIALRDVVLFWVGHGVKLFRVDNPHTKPFPFWEWLIGEVRAEHPDAVFLSEAFTRPKVMYRLAKIGFSQSYTYFTWRTKKREFEEYITEITRTEVKDFFRPHFFVNTPDINPPYLHSGERSWHLCRAALAATLSGLWGVYNGFELCEGRPLPGKEEYLNSEKYEIRHWDHDRPGNIVAEITRLNRIRKENPALRSHHGISFLPAHNDNILYYVKQSPGGRNTVLVAVNLQPDQVQEADIEVPHHLLGLPDHGTVAVEDLMGGHHFGWTGRWHRIRLAPEMPFAIWRLTAG